MNDSESIYAKICVVLGFLSAAALPLLICLADSSHVDLRLINLLVVLILSAIPIFYMPSISGKDDEIHWVTLAFTIIVLELFTTKTLLAHSQNVNLFPSLSMTIWLLARLNNTLHLHMFILIFALPVIVVNFFELKGDNVLLC